MTHPAQLVDNPTNGAKVLQEFGSKIYKLRKRLGLPTDQFGSIVGVHPSSISNWEKGQNALSQQSYDMLTDKYSELKTTEVEELIVLQKKPVGKPKGLPQNPRKVNGKHVSPTFPQVRNGKKEPEQLELEIQEAKPPHTNKQGVASLLIDSKTLAELLALDITNKHGRSEAIRHLRAAGATDDFILDVVHEALP
jgi:transcriptional regulator with XRE-family HTH domain